MKGDPVEFDSLDRGTQLRVLAVKNATGRWVAPSAIDASPTLKEIADRNDQNMRAAARDESAIARQRATTGAEFESEIAHSIERYKFAHVANIRRNFAPTRIVKTRRNAKPQRVLAKGGADVDWTGWVRVEIQIIGPPYYVPVKWPRGRVIPVAFDAKVLGTKKAGTYHHDVALQHQLHALKAAAELGEFAFLLVLARGLQDGAGGTLDRVFIIPILGNYANLLGAGGVRLFTQEGRGKTARHRPVLPSIVRPGDTGNAIGWDWIPLLQWATPYPDSNVH